MHWKNIGLAAMAVLVLGGTTLSQAPVAFAQSKSTDVKAAVPVSITERLVRAFKSRSKDSCAPTAPVQTELRFAGQPVVGVPIRLDLNVLAFEPGPNAEITWELPQGMRAVAGKRTDKGNIVKDKVHQFSTQIVIERQGDYKMSATAIMGDASARFGRRIDLWIRANADGSVEVSDKDPKPADATLSPAPLRTDLKPTPLVSEHGQKVTPPVPKLDSDEDEAQGDTATTTAYGYWSYRRGGGSLAAGYGTRVLLWDQDDFSGADYLGDAIVDYSGYWQVSFDNNTDGFLEPGTADVYVEFRTENGVVNVRDAGGGVFGTATGVIAPNIAGGSVNLGGWYADWGTNGVADANERAWQVHSDVSDAWAYSNYSLGFNTQFITTSWYDNSTDGTYYTLADNRIHLAEADFNSPDVIRHEYGHGHHDAVYNNTHWPPGSGGSHWFTGHYTVGLGYTEGYATYYGNATQGFEKWYDDNNPGNLIHFDCEANYDGNGTANGNSDGLSTGANQGYDTESAVLSMMIDVADSTNAPTDPYDWMSNNAGIWFDIMRNYKPGGHAPYTIQEVYDGWYARGWGAKPQVNGAMHNHGMFQGNGRSMLGITSGLSRYTGTWYWNGYGRGSYDVMNYASRNQTNTGFYVWLRFPDGTDAFGLSGDWSKPTLASGETYNVWLTQDHIASGSRVIGTYSLTAGHWNADGNWQVLEPSSGSQTNYITVPVVADTDAPDYCSAQDEGDVINNSTSLQVWAQADDYDSAIKGYWTQVGTSPGLGNVQGWIFHDAYNNTNWNTTLTGMTLAANTPYYITVVARNVENLDRWAYTDGIIAWDATPPTNVTATDDGQYTADLTQLHVVATAQEPDGKLMGYWTSVGTAQGATNIKGWEFTATDSTSFDDTITGLALVHGQTYYINVVARNLSGLDTWAYTNGITATTGQVVKGKINLLDFVGALTTQKVRFEVRNPGSTVPLQAFSVILAADGSYQFTTTLIGTYDLSAKGRHWLRHVAKNVNIPVAGVTVNHKLINGDVDGDNAVTVFDYARLSNAFDTSTGGTGWDPDADLDGDGSVTVFDYAILSDSFDMVGDD